MTTGAEAWPPPPSVDRPWRTERLPVDSAGEVAPRGRHRDVRVREVDLWGRTVLIDDRGRVFCDDCWRFLTVEVLGRPGNSHRVGITGWTSLPATIVDDGPSRQSPRWMTEGF